MDKIKILYIGYLKGAFQRDLIVNFRKHGFTVIPFYETPPFTFKKKLKILYNILKLGKKADVIFIEFLSDYAWIVSRLKNIIKRPIIVRCHRVELFEYFEKHKDRVKLALEKADAVICVSKFIMNRLFNLFPEAKSKKIYLVYNGVDVNTFKPIKVTNRLDGFITGSLGNLIKTKGFEELIDVIAELINEGLDIKLRIGGDGPLYNHLKNKVIKLGLREKIFIEGYIPHEKTPEWYNGLDLFILNSYIESHPHVILEAMSCGLPVIASNAGDVSQMIDKEWIYEPGDKDRLRKLIKKMYSLSESERAKIGKKNRYRIVKFFNAERQLIQIEEIIRDVLSREK